MASKTALAMAGAVGTSPGSPMPLAPNGPLVPMLSTQMRLDLGHVADVGDLVVEEAVVDDAAVCVVDDPLHEGEADPLRDGALESVLRPSSG